MFLGPFYLLNVPLRLVDTAAPGSVPPVNGGFDGPMATFKLANVTWAGLFVPPWAEVVVGTIHATKYALFHFSMVNDQLEFFFFV